MSSLAAANPFHNAPVLLVPAYAVVVSAPSGPDQGCPSPRQITEALTARIPAIVVPTYEAASPGVLRLSVSGGSPTVPLRIELTDPGGEARLFRNLTLAERGKSNDCLALAETVALIVDRFLHDLGYEAPPSPPPVPRAPTDNLTRGPPAVAVQRGNRLDVFAGGSWRGAAAIESDVELGLGLGLERGVGGQRLAATFSAGFSFERRQDIIDGSQATLRRIPLRFGLLMPLALGPGSLEPGLRLAVDWLIARQTWTNRSEKHMHASPGVEAVVGYRLDLVGRLFARLNASAGAGIPYQFVVTQDMIPTPTTVFREPRFYVKSGLELGFSFQ